MDELFLGAMLGMEFPFTRSSVRIEMWHVYMTLAFKKLKDDIKIDSKLKKFQPKEYESMEILMYNSGSNWLCERWIVKAIEDYNIRHSVVSNQTSSTLREKGNAVLKNSQYTLAIKMYSDALTCYTEDLTEFAYAHANRSVPLMSLGYFMEAFMDCEMAKELFYPKNKLVKLLHRQAKCAINLKNRILLANVIQELNGLNVVSGTKECFKSVDEYKIILENFVSDVDDGEQIQTDKIEDNENDREWKKATSNLTITETIRKDHAFAIVPVDDGLLAGTYKKVCHNCISSIMFVHPCYKCINTVYCSQKCRKEHLNFHLLECLGSKYDLWVHAPGLQLPLRMLLCGFDEMKMQLLKMNINSPPRKGSEIFNDLIKLAKTDRTFRYGQVLKLDPKMEKLDVEKYFMVGFSALLLFNYLKNHTDFFEELPVDFVKMFNKMKDVECFIGSILLRHCGHDVKNSQIGMDLRRTEHICSKHYDLPKLGYLHKHFFVHLTSIGIYPEFSANLPKHSCDPNVITVFNKHELKICALQDIKIGTELLTSYRPTNRATATATRQRFIKENFGFDCECSKCLEPDNKMDFDFYYCENANCRTPFYLPDSKLVWFEEFVPKPKMITTSAEQFFSTLQYYENSIKFLSKYHVIKQFMVKSLLTQVMGFGGLNVKDFQPKLLNLTLEYLNMVKFRYGELSRDYANESAFLLDLMARRKEKNLPQVENGLAMVEKSLTILSDYAKRIFDTYIEKYIR